VIRQGDLDGDKMYVVFRGELDVFKDNNDGRGPVKVFHYSDGDVFGELALMYDAPRAASVVCVTNVKAWSVDRMTFRTLLMNGAKRRREMYQEFLASVPLLQNLDRYERLKVADALTTETFADGQVIVREGESGEKFFLILEGQVRVEKAGVGETHNSPLEPWQYFGELALLGDEKRHATCTAIGTVQLAVMDKSSFDSLLGPIRDIMTRNCEDYDPAKGSADVSVVPSMLSRSRKNAVSSEIITVEDEEDEVMRMHKAPPPSVRSEEQVALLERVLGGSHLLADLDVHGRRQVYNAMKLETLPAGTDVIVQDDVTADRFYVVISGELDVFKDGVKVFHYTDGGVFGELALMYNMPRAATVRTGTEVKLWWVDRQTFRTVLMKESKKRRELYQDFLSKVPLLVNLDRYERLKIADSLQTDYFDEGQEIVQEGEVGNRFYLLIDGLVRVTVNGVETHNSPLHPGQYFGELALLNADPRKATCTAIGSCKVAYMERKAFDRLMGPVKDVMERTAKSGYGGVGPTDRDPLAPTVN
jgi:CRP-like cAMP-binding protein